jgi:hypothetical protein
MKLDREKFFEFQGDKFETRGYYRKLGCQSELCLLGFLSGCFFKSCESVNKLRDALQV